jgi:hypothetical protein
MRWIIFLIVAFIGTSAARAAIDPETKTPYRLRVVLRIAEHPHFTDHFCREMKRELQGSLQAALGTLGTVEIVDLRSIKKENWEPLWRQADEKGLASLDSFNEIGGGKTHFLFLDFNEDQYQLQARQHDGASGFVTPIVRKASTHVHGFVARLAAVTIGQDFGLVATLDPTGAGERVFIKVRGGELGPIDRWVKKGEVFAVVAERRRSQAVPNSKASPKMVGERVEDMLLLVVDDPRDGVIPCQMLYRYRKLQPGSGTLGFHCVKLGATDAPLRLRLVDAKGNVQNDPNLQVYAGSRGYPESEQESEQTVFRDGVFVSRQRFQNVAFVRVVKGTTLARIPVELLDDRVEIRTIQLDPKAEQRDWLDRERKNLIDRINDGRYMQVGCFREITTLELAGDKKTALDRAQTVLKLLDAATIEFQDDIGKLKAQAVEKTGKADSHSADCEQQLQILKSKQDELRQHLQALKTSIAQDNDPAVQQKKKKVVDLINAAKLFENQAEYDQALAKYEEALAEAKDEPMVKQQIDALYQKLKKAWSLRPNDPAHSDARKFILETWPKLATVKEVRDHLVAARKAFEKCKAANDRLAVNRMLHASVEVAARFAEELKKLSETAEMTMEEEDKKTLETYQKVNEDLIRLLKDVQTYATTDESK